MRFTVVITTYNRLDFLKRAIASALAQTVPCEVVVVDDASTDGTEAYVHSLGDQVTYHRNSQNLNHSSSVNAGVERATGDWVKFLDDDDFLAANCIERLSEAIVQHPSAVICSCRAIQVNEQGNELSRSGTVGPGQAFYVPQAAVHFGMLLDQLPFGTPVQVAARRDVFLKTGGWDTAMTANYDDIDAWIRIADHGDALFLNDYLAYRTLWQGGKDQRTDIAYRLDLNITIKKRIYERIHPTYRDRCPSIETLNHYMHLHWGLVASSQCNWRGARLLFPDCLHPRAWWLLWQVRHARTGRGNALIPKLQVDQNG